MASKYSDITQPQLSIIDYLPEVFRSDINSTLSGMIYDRYLTKDNTVHLSGYIGYKPNTTVARQISEPTPHRQAFQLAPTMYNIVGSEESALSYKNFLAQLELLGVSSNRLPLWADAQIFNWVPPVNIDMLINYQDYYWNPALPRDLPQYFTIENRCRKTQGKVDNYNRLIEQRGLQFPIIEIDFVNTVFKFTGNWTTLFTPDFIFNTNASNTPNLENKQWEVVSSSYNSGQQITSVVVTGEWPTIDSIPPTSPFVGQWWFDTNVNMLKFWTSTQWSLYTDEIIAQAAVPAVFPLLSIDFVNNSFIILGREVDIFVSQFLFYIKNSSSVQINNKFWTSLSSAYNSSLNTTTVAVQEEIAIVSETAPLSPLANQWWYKPSLAVLYSWNGTTWDTIPQTFNGLISLAELSLIFQSEINCACSQSVGWDMGQWDDNQIGNVVWNVSLLQTISFPDQTSWMAFNGAMTSYALWYDTTDNVLKQRNATNTSWVAIRGNFSSVLAQTVGINFWDKTAGCEVQKLNQWSSENVWIHKTSIQNYELARRAQVPILEYSSTTELNEWVEVTYPWKYRQLNYDTFVASDTGPTRLELEPIKGYIAVHVISNIWQLYLFDKTLGINKDIDYTDTFVPGFEFLIEEYSSGVKGASKVYTVEKSEYLLMTASHPAELQGYMVTVVTIIGNFDSPLNCEGTHFKTKILPVRTSKGDAWRGYHVHWCLDIDNVSSAPIANKQIEYFKSQDLLATTVPTTVVINTGQTSYYPSYTPQVSSLLLGQTYMQLSIEFSGITQIDLWSTLKFDPSIATPYALADGNELRVYVNGVRQYGTYSEVITSTVPNSSSGYIVIWDGVEKINVGGGNYITRYTNIPTRFVSSIIFNEGILDTGDVVRIEVGPAAFDNMGYFSIPVRTVEDDALFESEVSIQQQPVNMSLTTYHLMEQNKSLLNQYPLFNVYDLITGDVVKVSPLFAYLEDSSYDINSSTQRRIVASQGNFKFVQTLLDVDDGILYGYRNTSQLPVGTWWYSDLTNKIQQWDGYAWTSKIIIQDIGPIVRSPVISDIEPIILREIVDSLWFNTTVNKLYTRDNTTNSWIEIPGVVLNGADPSLQTVWKPGTNNERYVPSYVDSNRQPIAVNSVLGDWEVVQQWIYNPEHSNKSVVSYSQLISHFQTIIDNQPLGVGLAKGGTYSLPYDNYNYGVGGTIKEFSGSFDTLISAINDTNTTPLGVINFARNEYASRIQYLRDIFNKRLTSIFGTYTVDSLIDFDAYINQAVIDTYENNSFFAQVYGDSSTYDQSTQLGIKHMICTAPMFGLSQLYSPHKNVDKGYTEIFHHDGHRTEINVGAAESNIFSLKLISLPDSRPGNGTLGMQAVDISPPDTSVSFVANFGGVAIRPGVYWYKTGTTYRLYRCDLFASSDIPIPTTYNGVDLPDGIFYYQNVDVGLTVAGLYKKQGNSWVLDNPLSPLDISKVWTTVDFEDIFANIVLEIEQRLYAVTSNGPLKFNFNALKTAEPAVYNALYQQEFDNYVTEESVTTPYINTQYASVNPFSWNYVNCITTLPRPKTTGTVAPTASWQLLYTNWYGTPYPHLEPWCLQGYNNKPDWWDAEYLDLSGTRRWIYNHSTQSGMWYNIMHGIVPTGRIYPNGMISTGNPVADGQTLPRYNYVSVNIDDAPISWSSYNYLGQMVTQLPMDDLLPPYYNTLDTQIRSIFNDFSQIVAPDADYNFGDGSVIEWQWYTSSRYPYVNATIAFQMQPVRFLDSTFGNRSTCVDGLKIDVDLKRVYSHKNTLFHGDVYNNTSFVMNGLNQWYINFNRFSGLDPNGDFRTLWTKWDPRLTYQTGSTIDSNSLTVNHNKFRVTDKDYNVLLVNNGVAADMWVDAFDISVINIPPSVIQRNNQHLWKFEINTLSSVSRALSYYGVKSYVFNVDITTDTCTINNFNISGLDIVTKRFYVNGNVSEMFTTGLSFDVNNSTNNNGTFTTVSSFYESSLDRTRINVQETVNSDSVFGNIDIPSILLPWNTGDMIIVTSTNMLPYPLASNTPYFIVKTGNRTFKLAETSTDAIGNITINLTQKGNGVLEIFQIATSFNALGTTGNSKEVWYHVELDKSVIKTFSSPLNLSGMQHLINVIDGYAEYSLDSGILQNVADAGDFDPMTGRLVGWQLETERFIDWAYGLRHMRMSINDRYHVSVNTSTNEITFLDANPGWTAGTAIQFKTTGSLPSPIVFDGIYYVVPTSTVGNIKLSTNRNISDTSAYIDFTTVGSGTVYITVYSRQIAYPTFELNPSRNNIWLSTPQGVLSNVITGPYSDIRIKQTIFDQYSRALTSDKLLIYRDDLRNRIAIRANITNDIDTFLNNDPYNYIHLGGGHFFVEEYEHFVLMNNYTVEGFLVYDPFLGLMSDKLAIDTFKKNTYTLRPSLGGYYLKDSHFYRNFEGSADDLYYLYDTNTKSLNPEMDKRAKALLGYVEDVNYMTQLNVNANSQFQFYKGMIQAKGSVNSVLAYINSKHFADAYIDEYWAWKVAEFGDYRPRVYPEIKLVTDDSIGQEIRFEFLGPEDDVTDSRIVDTLSKGFQLITLGNDARWNNYPDQRAQVESALFLDAEVSSSTKILSTFEEPPIGLATSFDFWFDGTNLRKWNGTDWNTFVYNRIKPVGNYVYWMHDHVCDDVRIVRRDFNNKTIPLQILESSSSLKYFQVSGDYTSTLFDGMTFIIQGSSNPEAIILSSNYTSGITQVLLSGNQTSIFSQNNMVGVKGNLSTMYTIDAALYDVGTNITTLLLRVGASAFGNYTNVLTTGQVLELQNVYTLSNAYFNPITSMMTGSIKGECSVLFNNNLLAHNGGFVIIGDIGTYRMYNIVFNAGSGTTDFVVTSVNNFASYFPTNSWFTPEGISYSYQIQSTVYDSTGFYLRINGNVTSSLPANVFVVSQQQKFLISSVVYDSALGKTIVSLQKLGDYSTKLHQGSQVILSQVSTNDGVYTSVSTVYDTVTDSTNVYVLEPISADNNYITDGNCGTLIANVTNFEAYDTTFLTEGESGQIHYKKVNAETVRFDRYMFKGEIIIYTIIPSQHKISPARLIDNKQNLVLSDIPLWHPAMGIHYSLSERNINIKHEGDPALYNTTLNPNDASDRAWNFAETGKVWLDTTYLSYVPYYDTKLYPDIEDRLYRWGNLAGFGDIKAYKWVSSTIPPASWAAAVIAQQNDITVPQSQKITGTPKQMLFKRMRPTFTVDVDFGPTTKFSFRDASNIPFDSTRQVIFNPVDAINLPSGLSTAQTYNMSNISGNTFEITDAQGTTINATGNSVTAVVTSGIYEISTQITGVPVSVNTYGSTATPNFTDSSFLALHGIFTGGEIVQLSSSGQLPTGLNSVTQYVVTNVTLVGTLDRFTLSNLDTSAATFTDNGAGIISIFEPTYFKTNINTFVNNQYVLFRSSITLPLGLKDGTLYRITNVANNISTNNQTFQVVDDYKLMTTVDLTTNHVTFVNATPSLTSGQIVRVFSTGTLPAPLNPSATYYVVLTSDPNSIRLSTSSNVSDASSYITFTTTGTGFMYVGNGFGPAIIRDNGIGGLTAAKPADVYLRAKVGIFANDDVITLNSSVSLPTGLSFNTEYKIAHLSVDPTNVSFNIFKLVDPTSDAIVLVTGPESGTMTGSRLSDIRFQVNIGTYVNNDVVKAKVRTGILPKGLIDGQKYLIYDVQTSPDSVYQSFQLSLDGSKPVNILSVGTGNFILTNVGTTLKVTPTFADSDWTRRPVIRQHLPAAMIFDTSFPQIYPIIKWNNRDSSNVWYDGDNVDIYTNGQYITSAVVSLYGGDVFQVDLSKTDITFQELDVIDVVRPLHNLTDAEQSFNPEVYDNGQTLEQWQSEYEYTSRTFIPGSSTSTGSVTNYYFWVEHTALKGTADDDLSVYEIVNTMRDIPTPYFIVQSSLDAYTVPRTQGYDVQPFGVDFGLADLPEQYFTVPIAYREVIIRGITKYVSDNGRYFIRFVRDLTLRNDTQAYVVTGKLKNKHEEWLLFREKQGTNLPRELWNKLTEAVAGETLVIDSFTNTVMPVPSFDRIVYDQKYSTDTQYGLDVGQTFVNKQLGLGTIMQYLLDPTRDFSPISIEEFFKEHSFDTPGNIKLAMNTIYDTFGAEHVNGIWFAVLNDALTTKAKYKDLFKTSWINLHGVRILDVGGTFDE